MDRQTQQQIEKIRAELELSRSVDVRPIGPPFDAYFVTSEGDIVSTKRRPPKRLKQTENTKGYLKVELYDRDGRQKTFRVHRVVAKAFLGPCLPGIQVRHLDGNPHNNAVDNLEYGSPSDNSRDAVDHGTHHRPNGESNGSSKLTRSDVLVARKRVNVDGESISSVADDFPVTRQAMRRAVRGKTWSHLSGTPSEVDCE